MGDGGVGLGGGIVDRIAQVVIDGADDFVIALACGIDLGYRLFHQSLGIVLDLDQRIHIHGVGDFQNIVIVADAPAPGVNAAHIDGVFPLQLVKGLLQIHRQVQGIAGGYLKLHMLGGGGVGVVKHIQEIVPVADQDETVFGGTVIGRIGGIGRILGCLVKGIVVHLGVARDVIGTGIFVDQLIQQSAGVFQIIAVFLFSGGKAVRTVVHNVECGTGTAGQGQQQRRAQNQDDDSLPCLHHVNSTSPFKMS